MAERVKLSVEEYLAELLGLVVPLDGVEVVPLEAAGGRTLARPVVAASDVPPMANSAMDGFAVRASDLAVGATLEVVADVPAGSALDPALGTAQCCRIMTGAPLPTDADTIVPVELVEQSPDRTRITLREIPQPGAHVRGAADDFTRGVEVSPRASISAPANLGWSPVPGWPRSRSSAAHGWRSSPPGMSCVPPEHHWSGGRSMSPMACSWRVH